MQGQKIGKIETFPIEVLAESMGDLRGESKKRTRYKGREMEKRKAGRERSIRRIGLLAAERLERLAQQLIKGRPRKIYIDIEKFVEQDRRHVATIAP